MTRQGDENRREGADLGERLRRDDQSALAVILERYGRFTARALRTHYPSLSEQDLEDVLSTALFNLWKARTRYSSERGSLKSWFFLIARNVASDFAREKGPPPQEVDWDALVGPETQTEQPLAVPADPILRERLLAVLATLSEGDLRLLLEPTRSADGRWSEALAQELNIDAGTLRVRRSRLIKRLREALASEHWERAENDKTD